jgi:hypothetical protein
VGDQGASRAYRTALVVVLIATVMASLFVASYSLALGRPVPHRIPIGVVGDPARRLTLVAALQDTTDHALQFHRYPSAAAAEAAIDRQTMFAALVLNTGPSQLLISSASGASVALVLDRAAERVNELLAPGGSPVLHVVDIHPLPPNDPEGLVGFYVTIAATILGFVTMFQLRMHASGLPLRGWLAVIGVLAIGGGLFLALVADPLIHALRGAFLEVWAALAAQIAVAALFNSTMIVVLGRWAMIPTWLLFIAFGNAASGGAVAAALLPPLYAFLGRFMPSGATVSLIHQAVYFHHTQRLEPFLVEGGWLVGSLAALLVSVRRLGRTPTGARPDRRAPGR